MSTFPAGDWFVGESLVSSESQGDLSQMPNKTCEAVAQENSCSSCLPHHRRGLESSYVQLAE